MGDSKERNGSFIIAMTDIKRKLLGLNREHCLNELLDESDLMVFINIT